MPRCAERPPGNRVARRAAVAPSTGAMAPGSTTRWRSNERDAPIAIYEVPSRLVAPASPRTATATSPIASSRDSWCLTSRDMGFTHLELMPVTEYPFDGSWGYQPLGLFAPTSRFGTPDDFRAFVDACHAAGHRRCLLDWVPGHFPTDRARARALRRHRALRACRSAPGLPPDWNTYIYNFGRREVANFLLASALYWLERLPRRRLARRCRRLDALSRLQPPAGRMGAQQLRRPRESRGDRVPAAHQRD